MHSGDSSTSATMVVNGNEEQPYDEIIDTVVSPNGKRYAYIAKKGKKMSVVLDGKEGKPMIMSKI
ncbi:hypothetical protein HGA88_05725 [Candidatus Roizmanbacteria bacterium]|nr:hypothetical protein [Candidatus Roizmanbacteria bacterium]